MVNFHMKNTIIINGCAFLDATDETTGTFVLSEEDAYLYTLGHRPRVTVLSYGNCNYRDNYTHTREENCHEFR